MLSKEYFDKLSDDQRKKYLYGLTFFVFNKPEYKVNINKLSKCKFPNYIGKYPFSQQTDEYKLNIIISYPNKQKKKVKRWFKIHPIKLISDNPYIQVIKKYSRFDKIAKELGFLKSPKPTKDNKFEVYDDSSGGFFAELSPMMIGPVIDKYGDCIGFNIEDAWQASKVYSFHMNGKFDPKAKKNNFWKPGNKTIDYNKSDEWLIEWKKWSEFCRFSGEGLRRRCKLIKDKNCINPNIPLFSYYRGEKLSYVESRKKMYIPWYADLVVKTRAFKYLKERFRKISLIILDPDGQPRDQKILEINEKTMREKINDPKFVFGHGYVLACVLLNINVWN